VLRDERVAPVLTHVSEAYLGSDDFGRGGRGGDVGGADDKLSPRDVDDLARSAMPLCMSALHTALKERHHLKHGGRMQYSLYLKGAGLGLEDALAFWQAEFSASMSAEDFLKRYAYNIRHNYGKEGRRADYRPYHCQKIIMGSPPGVGEVHGCPYRHWDEPHLRAALARSGLGGAAVEDVLGSVRTHDYQLACRKQWEARFGCRADDVGNHPNVYTREARLALRGQHPAQSATVRDAAAKAAAAAAAAAAASSTTTTTGAPAEAGATAGAGAGSDAGEPRSDAPASPQGGGAAPHGGAALVTPPPALPAGRGLGLEP
jgi:DNA primase large subunit